jgi:hypothetical protein
MLPVWWLRLILEQATGGGQMVSTRARYRLFFASFYLLLVVLSSLLFLSRFAAGSLLSEGGQIALAPPVRIGGASGLGDERDADVYPVLAYDPVTQRYLSVWLSVRNATSINDGLDVYGIFLDQAGQPVGSEFRISDSNTAARNGPPAVAVGQDGFVVAWTVRGSRCHLYVQQVSNNNPRSDQLLSLESVVHHHSPRLVYHSARRSYTVAYVAGEDYLPPTLSGAAVADCGDNAAGPSQIRMMEFTLEGGVPVPAAPVAVSPGNGAAYRPSLAYGEALDQYLVAWEDRRSEGADPYRFDVYARRWDGGLVAQGNEFPLATSGSYVNDNTLTTWTPRPALAAGNSHFLAAWFWRTASDSATAWSVQARLIAATGAPQPPFTVAQITFTQSHAGNAPAGFLGAAYAGGAQEYLVAMTSHMESLRGYFSLARFQRVSAGGQLLALDGSVQSAPAAGYAVDSSYEDQIGVALTVGQTANSSTEYVFAYSKRTPRQHARDIDIWGVHIQLAGGGTIPSGTPTHTPTPTSTPTPAATGSPAAPTGSPTPTVTSTPAKADTPTPTSTASPTPVSGLILPDTGGKLAVDLELHMTLFFPPEAVSQPVIVTVQEASNPPALAGFHLLGPVFAIDAYTSSGTPVQCFGRPFTITIHYADSQVAGIDERALALYTWQADMESWIRLPTAVDAAANTLTANLECLALFAVLEDVRPRIYLPSV